MTGRLAQLPPATLQAAIGSLGDVEQTPEEVSARVCDLVRPVGEKCFPNWAGMGGMKGGVVLNTGIECV